MCGEKKFCTPLLACISGSPPRVRGKVNEFDLGDDAERITPACAGKSAGHRASAAYSEDHPRVCGEKSNNPLHHLSDKGSPPRVRGKVNLSTANPTVPRITPACAGKSPKPARTSCHSKDHPRVCGEKAENRGAGGWMRGSPPRVRGKGVSLSEAVEKLRITPACAGKSWTLRSKLIQFKDHPRVCGEKGAQRAEKGKRRGSPPRVRGKVLHLGEAWGHIGITPACAGKSHFAGNYHHGEWDHPRVCGEKPIWLPFLLVRLGSPPRVRGKGHHGPVG